MTKLVDLTLPISSKRIPELSDFYNSISIAEIEYLDHQDTVPQVTALLGCKPEHLPNGLGWSVETVTMTTHMGTHMDAPYHYGPLSGGEPAMTIDQIPLEWCFADGVVLDLQHLPPRSRIQVGDLQQALEKLSYELKPFDIVLLRTGWDRFHGTKEYVENYPGMTRDATIWLVGRGIRIIGTDALGFDRPFEVMAEDFRQTGNAAFLWEAHYAGTTTPYLQIEKLANLGEIPPVGFKLSCFPIPVERASGAWIRAVAFVEE